MNVKTQGVGKNIRIVVWSERRRAYHCAFRNSRSSDLGVASGNARKGEIAIAPETKAFFECVGTTAGLQINCANCSGYV